jgi:hypothetical protein
MKTKKRMEPDLYVNSRPMTEAESEEISLFIANYKKTHKLIYPKIKPATTTRKTKKYEVVEPGIPFFREPESDLYADFKPMTVKGKKKRKVAAKRNLTRKKRKE